METTRGNQYTFLMQFVAHEFKVDVLSLVSSRHHHRESEKVTNARAALGYCARELGYPDSYTATRVQQSNSTVRKARLRIIAWLTESDKTSKSLARSIAHVMSQFDQFRQPIPVPGALNKVSREMLDVLQMVQDYFDERGDELRDSGLFPHYTASAVRDVAQRYAPKDETNHLKLKL